MKRRPPGKRPRGRSGGAGRGVTSDTPRAKGQGMTFRNSVAEGQTPPTEDCPITQQNQQAGVS